MHSGAQKYNCIKQQKISVDIVKLITRWHCHLALNAKAEIKAEYLQMPAIITALI